MMKENEKAILVLQGWFNAFSMPNVNDRMSNHANFVRDPHRTRQVSLGRQARVYRTCPVELLNVKGASLRPSRGMKDP